jgi:hypothetical protein
MKHKSLDNDTTKGLTNVNYGVQIYNIWLLSVALIPLVTTQGKALATSALSPQKDLKEGICNTLIPYWEDEKKPT